MRRSNERLRFAELGTRVWNVDPEFDVSEDPQRKTDEL